LPGFRVDKELVERRLESLKRRGIRFQMGVTFGQNVKLSELRREFDAVFLGFGLADAMPLDVPGANCAGLPVVSVCQPNALPAAAVGGMCGANAWRCSAAVTPRWTSSASPSAAGPPPPCASIAATSQPAADARNTEMPGGRRAVYVPEPVRDRAWQRGRRSDPCPLHSHGTGEPTPPAGAASSRWPARNSMCPRTWCSCVRFHRAPAAGQRRFWQAVLGRARLFASGRESDDESSRRFRQRLHCARPAFLSDVVRDARKTADAIDSHLKARRPTK